LIDQAALSTDPAARSESWLYRDQAQWWLKFVVRPHNPLAAPWPVPNLAYADERHFYQYLEEWLLHYTYQDEQGHSVTLPGLRSCFQPQHDYLFTMKQGQPYSQASAFMALLRNPAYRLTGKVLTPETVRRSFADYYTAYMKEHGSGQTGGQPYLPGSYASVTRLQRLQAEDTDLAMVVNQDQQDLQWLAAVVQKLVKPVAKGKAKTKAKTKTKAAKKKMKKAKKQGVQRQTKL
jgi:hypothetical protein